MGVNLIRTYKLSSIVPRISNKKEAMISRLLYVSAVEQFYIMTFISDQYL